LLPTRIDDEILEHLDPEHFTRASTVSGESKALKNPNVFTWLMLPDDNWRLPYNLELRAGKEFSYEIAKAKLTNLHLGQPDGPQIRYTVPGDVLPVEESSEETGRLEQLLRLSGLIDLNCAITVSASPQRDS
jgi:hypothetical protein